MLIGVNILRAPSVIPPVRRQSPIGPTVIGAEQVDSAGPHRVGISRVHRDGIVVPALVEDRIGGPEAAGCRGRSFGIREQQRVEISGAGISHPGGPRPGIPAAGGTENRKQPLLVIAAFRDARGEGVDRALARWRDGQRCKAHVRFRVHHVPGSGPGGVRIAIDCALGEVAASGEDVIGGGVGAHRQVEASVAGRGVNDPGPGRAGICASEDAGPSGGINPVAGDGADHQLVHKVKPAVAGGAARGGPGSAAIGALEDAGAANRAYVKVALTGSRVNHIGVVRIHGQGTHGQAG